MTESSAPRPRHTLAFIAEGDANTADCWSGCARGFVQALRDAGARVDVVDVEVRGVSRTLALAAAYHPQYHRWRLRYRLGGVSFALRSQLARAGLSRRSRYDAIIQAGATFDIPHAVRAGALSVVYADANIAFASRGRPYSGVASLTSREIAAATRRERRVYDSADRVWTWSHALEDSFVDDFAQERARLLTIYAGANTDPSEQYQGRVRVGNRPRVLFVGKDYRRKGLDLVLQAFETVRRQLPEAELHIVGGTPPVGDSPGVVVHGYIQSSSESGRRHLADLYASSTVFCLPSRYEPFGVSFIEAMLAELPCVGVNAWAMPEIIEHGVTGWLLPTWEPEPLAQVLIDALSHVDRAAALGRAGRQRALREFTWGRVAERALADLERMLSSRQPPTNGAAG